MAWFVSASSNLQWKKVQKVLLDPPNFNPGSWCGAGKLWIEREDGEYWLTSRPREGELKR